MANTSWNATPFKKTRTKAVSSRNFRSKETADCPYCDSKIRVGMPVTRDFEIRALVHAGCYQRVNGRIRRANDSTPVQGAA
jgi:DNA-directed RNA polymerase subunit RPC12/RpoP